jgi:hypothetical protein
MTIPSTWRNSRRASNSMALSNLGRASDELSSIKWT